jgi:poly(3-hydroxybutyrate) depolymerase
MAGLSSTLLLLCLLLAATIWTEVKSQDSNNLTQPITTSNLNPLCNGDGPEAISSALPLLKLPAADVPQFCFEVAGRQRCYYVMVPEGTVGAVPLVFDIHAFESCPLLSITYTGWFQQAQANKFVIVWPLGVTDAALTPATCFAMPGGVVIGDVEALGCCCTTVGDNTTRALDANVTMDIEFLRMAIEQVIDTTVGSLTKGAVSIDPRKVFMAGHSNGCVAALSMAALHSDIVTGVACHAGKFITPFPKDYKPVPIFLVQGLLDQLFNFSTFLLTQDTGFPSTLDMVKFIADRNGCGQDTRVEQLPDDEGTVKYRFDCINNANVTLVTLNRAGHIPFLGVNASAAGFDEGSVPTTIDTTALAWEFLSSIGTSSVASSNATTNAPATAVPPSPTAPAPSPYRTTSTSGAVRRTMGAFVLFLTYSALH